MPDPRRAVLGDALLATGATLILLAVHLVLAIALGAALAVAGAFLLWRAPQPEFRTRAIATAAGLFYGYVLRLVMEGLVPQMQAATLLAAFLGSLALSVALRLARPPAYQGQSRAKR